MADYYAILGISHASEGDEVAKAYRRAALTYNPECNPQSEDLPELARRFKLVSQAYVVLSDPKTRAIYDMYGEAGVRHGGTFDGGNNGLDVDAIDPDAVFRRFFGVDNPFQMIGTVSGLHGTQHHFFSEAAAAKADPAKQPVPADVTVTLEEVLTGATKTARWTAGGQEYTIDVQVPRGVANNAKTVLQHPHGGPVAVTIRVAEHERYKREGNDLHYTVAIKLAEALTGTTVTVTQLDGVETRMLIDEIVHPAFTMRIDGAGLPDVNTGKRGDMVVHCATEFPKYLSAEQRRELRRVLAE